MTYKLGNRNIKIPDNEIEANMNGLQVSKNEAIEIWLEDNDYLTNDAQAELDKKAADCKITATVHKAQKDKREKAPVKREPKPDMPKETLIAKLADFLRKMDCEEVNITNKTKLIFFKMGNDYFELNLVRKNKNKLKKGE